MSKLYAIENRRPRRTVHLYGRTLAPRGRGRTSIAHLSEEELLGDPCVRLLQLKRIAVLDAVPESLRRLLTTENSSEVAVDTPMPEVEEELAEASESGEAEGSSGGPPSPDDGETSAPKVWTEEELLALSLNEQKDICRDLGLKVGGTELARVQRILDAQQEA